MEIFKLGSTFRKLASCLEIASCSHEFFLVVTLKFLDIFGQTDLSKSHEISITKLRFPSSLIAVFQF